MQQILISFGVLYSQYVVMLVVGSTDIQAHTRYHTYVTATKLIRQNTYYVRRTTYTHHRRPNISYYVVGCSLEINTASSQRSITTGGCYLLRFLLLAKSGWCGFVKVEVPGGLTTNNNMNSYRHESRHQNQTYSER